MARGAHPLPVASSTHNRWFIPPPSPHPPSSRNLSRHTLLGHSLRRPPGSRATSTKPGHTLPNHLRPPNGPYTSKYCDSCPHQHPCDTSCPSPGHRCPFTNSNCPGPTGPPVFLSFLLPPCEECSCFGGWKLCNLHTSVQSMLHPVT
jgi:hypothetical protein